MEAHLQNGREKKPDGASFFLTLAKSARLNVRHVAFAVESRGRERTRVGRANVCFKFGVTPSERYRFNIFISSSFPMKWEILEW
jgi:hypothetical protein